jgi:hypothetical protein
MKNPDDVKQPKKNKQIKSRYRPEKIVQQQKTKIPDYQGQCASPCNDGQKVGLNAEKLRNITGKRISKNRGQKTVHKQTALCTAYAFKPRVRYVLLIFHHAPR